MTFWTSNPGHIGDLAAGVLLMVIAVAVLIRTVRTPSLLGVATVGFSLIAFVMVAEVWSAYFDSTRVLAPLLTAYLLMVPSSTARSDAQVSRKNADTLTSNRSEGVGI